jgi:phage-related protein
VHQQAKTDNKFRLTPKSIVPFVGPQIHRLVKTVDKIPEKFLKHLEGTDGLYEIRVKVSSDIFRILCCFDKGNIVVLFNAFQKKSQKTPKKEIELAEKLKKKKFYFKTKRK